MGAMCSLHARTLRRGAARKASWPSGHASGGLIMADAMGRMLTMGAAPPCWDGIVRMTEGVPGYLATAAAISDAAPMAPAVYGYVTGAWTPAHAQRIPSGATVLIWAHTDDAGQRMAAQIAATLGNCDIRLTAADNVEMEDAHGART
jgi:hypothetical protein